MSIKDELWQLIKPYYLVNIILSLSFIVTRTVKPMCSYVFATAETPCELSMREQEIMFFLLIVIVMRARKTGSVTMLAYLSTGFMYAKVASTLLWFYTDPRFGILYGVIFILQAFLLPEPSYSGPANIVYFRGSSLEEEIQKDKKVTWIVTFYTVWSPSCVNFAPIFAKLSAEYALDNLKFAKIDVGRYPELAKKFWINDTSFSRQLPTVVLFRDGKEFARRPDADSKGKLQKFIFTEDNVKAAFDLNNIYNECKSKLKDKKPAIREKSE